MYIFSSHLSFIYPQPLTQKTKLINVKVRYMGRESAVDLNEE